MEGTRSLAHSAVSYAARVMSVESLVCVLRVLEGTRARIE